MSYKFIKRRLDAGEIIVLDGVTGTESLADVHRNFSSPLSAFPDSGNFETLD